MVPASRPHNGHPCCPCGSAAAPCPIAGARLDTLKPCPATTLGCCCLARARQRRTSRAGGVVSATTTGHRSRPRVLQSKACLRALLFQRDSNPRPIGYRPIALPTEPWKVARAVRVELTTSSFGARALPLSYARLYPSLPHRGIRPSNLLINKGKSAPGRNSRASPADNAFTTNSFLPYSARLDVANRSWKVSWHRRQDSNPQLPRSKRGTLPIELRRRKAGRPCRNRTCLVRIKSPLPRHSAKDLHGWRAWNRTKSLLFVRQAFCH